MILQIIDLLRALDYVQGSSLSPDEKRSIATELKCALPAKALCHGAHITHEIADALFQKAINANTVRNNGPSTGESPGQANAAKEDQKEGHQLPGLRPRKDGVTGDDRKAFGGAKKVARGR